MEIETWAMSAGWIQEYSPEFITDLLDNIETGIFLMGSDFRIHQVNRWMSTIFEKAVEEMVNSLLGNAIGCEHAVRAQTDCGLTKHCGGCVLRNSFTHSFGSKAAVDPFSVSRYFVQGGRFEKKHLLVKGKWLKLNGTEYLLCQVDDVSKAAEARVLRDALNAIFSHVLPLIMQFSPSAERGHIFEYMRHEFAETILPLYLPEGDPTLGESIIVLRRFLEDLGVTSSIELIDHENVSIDIKDCPFDNQNRKSAGLCQICQVLIAEFNVHLLGKSHTPIVKGTIAEGHDQCHIEFHIG